MNAVIEHMSDEGKDKGEREAGENDSATGAGKTSYEPAYEKQHLSGLGRDHRHDHDYEQQPQVLKTDKP